jgi:two-component system, cell cycle response regulator DivK
VIIDRRRILVVEDNDASRELFACVVEDLGAEVACAEDGVAGLRIATEQKPDLIITDIAMPRMDGFEMVRRLRAMPETSHVPVVAVTAHDGPREMERAREVGCDGVVPKPCLPETLASVIEEWVGGRRRTIRRDHGHEAVVVADRRLNERRRLLARH